SFGQSYSIDGEVRASFSEIFDFLNGMDIFRIDDMGCAKPSRELEFVIADIASDNGISIDDGRCRNRAQADPACADDHHRFSAPNLERIDDHAGTAHHPAATERRT